MALTALLLAAGGWYYRAETSRLRAARYEEIAAIGELKAGQIQQWRKERLSDAIRFAHSPIFKKSVAAFLRQPGGETQVDLHERLSIERTAAEYSDALLVGPNGMVLLALTNTLATVTPATRQAIAAVLADREVVMSDLFRDSAGGIKIDTVVALRDATGQALAVVVLRSDAEGYLYPLVQSWPTLSRSGETLIVQSDSDSVVFLSKARHQTNLALTVSLPLSRTAVPAVQAALGRRGVFEGSDYRGVPVLADLRAIPGSDWLLVSKVDKDEIFAELRSRTGLIVLAVTAFILLGAVVTASVYRQQNAAAVIQLNAYNRSLIEASLDPLVTISAEGKITDVNEASVRTTGVPRAQLVGTDFSDYFIDSVKAREAYARVFSEGFVRDYPLAIRHATGGVTEVLFNATVYRGARGQVLGVSAAARDITERKQAEAEIKNLNLNLELRVAERTRQLAQTEERMRFALAASRTGAWDLNLEDHTAVRSLEHDQIFGYAELQPEWTLELFLNHVLPEDRAAVETRFRHAHASQSDWNFECRIRRADGETRWIWSIGRLNQSAGGGSRHMGGIIQDITERKLAELEIASLNQDLRKRTSQLETANQELESFSYSVSHDLRAPLRGIDGWSHAVMEDYGGRLDEQGREFLAQVCAEAQRMGQLIDDLLRLSRLGRAEMRREPVDLSALARTILASLRQHEPQRQVEATVDPNLHATGDPLLLQLVMQNLLENAWKFTSKRASARIEIGVVEKGKVGAPEPTPVSSTPSLGNSNAPVFFVRDNGAGFDMAHAAKLFAPFQRLHRTSEFPGTGIGLTTVQRIIHRHGGQIWAEAARDQGATFYFTLPISEFNSRSETTTKEKTP